MALEDVFKNASTPVASVIVIAVAAALTLVAYLLHRKQIVVKL